MVRPGLPRFDTKPLPANPIRPRWLERNQEILQVTPLDFILSAEHMTN
jgi:hypothetical protein